MYSTDILVKSGLMLLLLTLGGYNTIKGIQKLVIKRKKYLFNLLSGIIMLLLYWVINFLGLIKGGLTLIKRGQSYVLAFIAVFAIVTVTRTYFHIDSRKSKANEKGNKKEISDEKLKEEPVEKPKEELVEKPKEELVEKPKEEPVEKSDDLKSISELERSLLDGKETGFNSIDDIDVETAKIDTATLDTTNELVSDELDCKEEDLSMEDFLESDSDEGAFVNPTIAKMHGEKVEEISLEGIKAEDVPVDTIMFNKGVQAL